MSLYEKGNQLSLLNVKEERGTEKPGKTDTPLMNEPSGPVRPLDALLSPEELDWRCEEEEAGRNPSEVECFCFMK